jgi:polar amino acid transport system substrate-binding protein
MALLVLIAAMSGPARSQTVPILISDNDWKPWYFAGETTGRAGFAKDVIRHCVREAGFAPTFRHFPIPRMKAMMKRGRMDASIFSFKPHRESFLVYSRESLFREIYVPFVRRDSGVTIRRLEDFDTLRIGHLNGLSYSREFLAYINKRRSGGTLDVTTSNEGNLRKLVTEKIDVFVDTISSVRWHANEMGVSEQIRDLDYTVRSADYFFTLSRQSNTIADKAKFIAAFDACVRDLKQTDGYAVMARKYGMTVADLRTE